uniref:Uncharacterized protein n=1 Tax=Haptolina brevifila TaxID=156173 RepID=A0A7S2IIQ0_9EUKA
MAMLELSLTPTRDKTHDQAATRAGRHQKREMAHYVHQKGRGDLDAISVSVASSATDTLAAEDSAAPRLVIEVEETPEVVVDTLRTSERAGGVMGSAESMVSVSVSGEGSYAETLIHGCSPADDSSRSACTSSAELPNVHEVSANVAHAFESSEELSLSSEHSLLVPYACSDSKRRAGMLWVSNGHVVFHAAGGARVVVHLLRIRSIHLPSSILPRSFHLPNSILPRARVARALRLTLTGEPRVTESFYGFTERQAVLHEMLDQAASLGHVIQVTGQRYVRVHDHVSRQRTNSHESRC